ncbi:MAG: thioredoxin domain-containing protein [Xanthomonadaceae bacterium]|nr:thioredoxin domain-containing protein [Xanthomonadaceae bacterium]
MANRLAQEHSLYLKQHGDNPVDWYPWSEEALSLAKSENKLIHLSVGYSSCHWCHVMAHECFENPAIAQLMNERFINIKVDREERPDIDAIYQNVAQIFTRGGGWPLTVFMLPDGRPVYGGTYFPPEDKYGRPGFPRVLMMLSEMWDSKNGEILDNAKNVNEVMSKLIKDSDESVAIADQSMGEVLTHARDYFEKVHDPVNGGFGQAPKFPNTMGLTFMWRSGAHKPVIQSILSMINGGVFDQLGGGFHRYSVDETWSVPHFEKMLYDQALLLKLIAEVLCTQQLESVLKPDEESRLRESLILSLQYLNREMKSDQGMFYMAQDADTSMGEGFNFVWDPASVRECFSDSRDADLFLSVYRVRDGGNFEHGQTVLSYQSDLDTLAIQNSISKSKLRAMITRIRSQAFDFRQSRPKPMTDTKISSGLNGLLLSALSWSYGALKDDQVLKTALELATQLEKSFWNRNTKRLKALEYQSESKAFFSDYVYLARGLIDLCRVLPSDSAQAINFWNLALDLTKTSLTLFRDASGEWSETSSEHEKLIFKTKSGLDQAVPASTSVWLECALALESVHGIDVKSEIIKMSGVLLQHPFGSGELGQSMLAVEKGIVHVTHPENYVGFMSPRMFVKPDALVKRAQYCVGQTCYPYDGIESVRLSLI